MTYFRRGNNGVSWTQRQFSVKSAISYAKAEASLLMKGPVSPEVFEGRKSTCMGCEHRATDAQPPDEIGYCKKCGCGVSVRARLTVKLTMPDATCPLSKWPEGPSEPQS